MNFSNLASGIRFKATGVVPGIAAKRSKSAGGAQILIVGGVNSSGGVFLVQQ